MLTNLRNCYFIALFSIAVAAVGMTSFVEKFNVNFFDVFRSLPVQLCVDFYDDYNYSPEPNFLVEQQTSTTNIFSFSEFIVISHHYLSAFDFIRQQLPATYLNLFSWFDSVLEKILKMGYLFLSMLILNIIKVVLLKVLQSMSVLNPLFNFSYLQFSHQHSRR